MALSHASHCTAINPKYRENENDTECRCRRRDKHPLPNVRHCRFSCYTDDSTRWPDGMTLEQIVSLSIETCELWARAENSGSESSYVEVARWSNDRSRWERFAFAKMLDAQFVGDDGEYIELDDFEKAKRLADLINTETDFSFIHHLPTWEGASK